MEAAEEAWREAAAADERAEAERQAELRAVKQQLCDKCVDGRQRACWSRARGLSAVRLA